MQSIETKGGQPPHQGPASAPPPAGAQLAAVPAPATPAAPVVRVPRMSLANVKTGRIATPLREIVYGFDGVGKTAFAADAPKPIFLSARADGTTERRVDRFPVAKSIEDVGDAIRFLGEDKHDYQTLVLDDADWLEPFIWEKVCKTIPKEDESRARHIEDYGFKRGYDHAAAEWLNLTGWIDWLQAKRGLHVILTVHARIIPFKNPQGPDYERFGLKLDGKAAAVLREWAKSVLFAQFDSRVELGKKGKSRAKGVSSSARYLHTRWNAAFDAKTRHDIPERLPLSWIDFARAIERGAPAAVDPLVASIQAGINELADEADQKDAAERLMKAQAAAAGGDKQALAKLDSWISTKLDEQNSEEPAAPMKSDEGRQPGSEG
jgi:hypothetical protein